MTTSPEAIEEEIRALVVSVQLICEADIDEDTIARAESLIMERIRRAGTDGIHRIAPATYAAFLAIRGASRYEGNRFWPTVGITAHTSEAGQEFLLSLRSLGLPDFQREVEQADARRYVAPILVHGALPASVATRLVERVTRELERGLLNGSEARERMLFDPELVHELRRPAVRLLEWCPLYAEWLLERIIDHIEEPGGLAAQALPLHLRRALEQVPLDRIGPRRLVTPIIEFSLWSGCGPEVVGRGHQRWVAQINGRSETIRSDDRIELDPRSAVQIIGAGRQLTLLEPADVLFFTASGQHLPPDTPLPSYVVAVLPRRWNVRHSDGSVVPESEEGLPLTAGWSDYRSCALRLHSGPLYVGPRDEPLHLAIERAVDCDVTPHIVGTEVEGAHTAVGGPVFDQAPRLVVPGEVRSPLPAVVSTPGRPERFVTLRRAPDRSGYDLSTITRTGAPFTGTVRVISPSTTQRPLSLTWVDGLRISAPSGLVGPEQEATLHLTAAAGLLKQESLRVAAPATSADVGVHGLPEGTLAASVPRILWTLRSTRLARLDLATGPISISHRTMIDNSMRLIVRCGVAAEVRAELCAGESDLQPIPPRMTRRTGPFQHHAVLSLDVLRETIRQRESLKMRIDLIVGDQRFAAVHFDGVETIERQWVEPARPTSHQLTPLPRVPWAPDHVFEFENDAPLEAGADFERQLQQMSIPDAVVEFLRQAGHRQASWPTAQRLAGAARDEWNALSVTANRLWRIDGLRLREFSDDLDQQLRRWAHNSQQQIRNMGPAQRFEIEAWLFGRGVDSRRLADWPLRRRVEVCLPTGAGPLYRTYPASLLYHALSFMGGSQEAGPVVRECVSKTPEMVLHVVAIALQIMLLGQRISALPPVEEDTPEPPAPASQDEQSTSTLVDLNECHVEVAERRLVVHPQVASSLTFVRVMQHGRPLVCLPAAPIGDGLTFELPPDVEGEVVLTAVSTDGIEVGGAKVIEAPAKVRPQPMQPVRTPDPSVLRQAMCDALIDRISDAIEAGRLPRDEIEQLFEDEREAVLGLLRKGERTASSHRGERLLIACLPALALFRDPGTPPGHLRAARRLEFAALAPRTAGIWTSLKWPNSERFASPSSGLNDAVGFIARLARRHERSELQTFRYPPEGWYPLADHVDNAIARLDSHGVQRPFVDLLVAAHRLLTVERYVDESTRTLLRCHGDAPDLTVDAVIGALALFLATSEIERARS